MQASLTSFYFLCFLAVVILLYYVIPKKLQWGVLLTASIAYYLLSGNGILILYPVLGCLVAYAGTLAIERSSKRKLAFGITLLLLLGTLFALKYVNFIINTVNALVGIFNPPFGALPNTSFAVPLGISFYTFTILGYVIDVYNKITEAQKNYFKLLCFGMYFPTVLSGPIMKYREDSEQFFTAHKVNYDNLCLGAQRILWGFFKTIVISERMRVIVDTVYDNPSDYTGIYVIFATICYAFELYTNFSGAMDIVLGISQMLGLRLPENFETPFFSQTVSEYWRKWHITLGVWMKEYVFYPLLRTGWMVKVMSKSKEKFGKKKGKMLATFLAMFILWFTVGVWHGGDWKYVIGSGLLHWLYIVSEEATEPFFNSLWAKLKVNPKSKVLVCIRVVRTFLLVCIGFIFFRANTFSQALLLIKNIFGGFGFVQFVTGGIFTLGLDPIEAVIALVSLGILICVSALCQKQSVRERISTKPLALRWIIWYALLFYTILLGYYGPGFSAAEFIYQGF